MKTRSFLTLGATALVAITLNATAADTLLTPRAAGNQIKHISGTANDVNPASATTATGSPRAIGNQIKRVAGTNSDVNPVALCTSHMIGSPKQIAECASHPGAPMACCNVATK